MQLVAVYGSLKQGFGNHRFLVGSNYIGDTLTEARYTMYSLGGFPAVVPIGDTSIMIEVYDVDDETLRRLDMLEGHPDFYHRSDIETRFGTCIMYVLDRCESGNIIEQGVW